MNETLKELIKVHGLRGVVDAVSVATEELHTAGIEIKCQPDDEEPICDDDIRTAIANLREYLF